MHKALPTRTLLDQVSCAFVYEALAGSCLLDRAGVAVEVWDIKLEGP